MTPQSPVLHLREEHEIPGSPWDAAIRDALCACFPRDATVFARSRAWHESAPAYAVFLAEDDQVVAHTAVVSRTVTNGGIPVQVAGLQGVCVRREW